MGDNEEKQRIRKFFATMDARYINEIWSTSLNPAIRKTLMKDTQLGLSVEELYRITYAMVLHNHGEMIYKGTRETITEHLVGQVRQNIMDSVSAQFLSTLLSTWNNYQGAMIIIRDILMYAERVYVSAQRLDPIYKMGVILFRDNITRYEPIHEKLKSALLELIGNQRSGITKENTTLKAICQMLMSLYSDSSRVCEDFQIPFLKESIEFYQLKSKRLVPENNVLEVEALPESSTSPTRN